MKRVAGTTISSPRTAIATTGSALIAVPFGAGGRSAQGLVVLVLGLVLLLSTPGGRLGGRRVRHRLGRLRPAERSAPGDRPRLGAMPSIRGGFGVAMTSWRPRLRRLGWLRPRSDVEHAELLESVARSMRGGCSLTQALEESCGASAPGGPVTDLHGVMRSVRAGVPIGEALTGWSASTDDDARRLAGAALTLGADLGGASARSLDAAASGLRDRAALAREVRALTSQARTSALVMVAAPVVFVALGAASDPRVAGALLTTPVGLSCLVAGITLDLIGAAWMARMTRQVT
jgi:Flp pilus assembly protein TadB